MTAHTASLRFGELGQVLLAFGDPSLQAGVGTHRLVLPIKANGSWLDPDQPQTSNAALLLTGTVWSHLPTFRWFSSLLPQVLTLRGYQLPDDLTIDLSDDQLIALERSRGEGDVSLQLKLQGTLLGAKPDVYPIANEDTPYRIQRSRWLEQLDQLGREVGIVLRIPSPLTDGGAPLPPPDSPVDAASLAQAVARLRQARDELRDQRCEPSVATCRKVLENIKLLAELPPPHEVFNVNPKDRTQQQRWAAIYHDAVSLTSAAHHDDKTTAGFTWRRADAEAALAMTAGLLRRLVAGND
jgi:hypothetical protein